MQNAEKLAARFEAATPSKDPQILIWSDASLGGRRVRTSGGIGVVCEICLPGKAKYTIEEAGYVDPDKSIVTTEARGILKGLRRIKKEIKSAGLERGTRLTITVITDCKSNVDNLSSTTPMKAKTAMEYMAVIERIKILSQLLLRPRLNVTLELHWCPRNTTPQMVTADFLAGHARIMGKRSWAVFRETGYVKGRVRDCPGANRNPNRIGGHARENCTRRGRRRKIPTGKVIEEELEDSLESASPPHKKQRMCNEDTQAASATSEPQDTVAVPENTQDRQPDNEQVHCAVM